MHLKSLTLKGFKSFPDRTRLEFGPGVSVIVGPNGSGKSNITDAVLWVMGEQSPLAVRGGSMQDVIFGGGKGVTARSAAEVEVVLDNSDGAVDLPFGEIAISRRLDRSGDGEYRINGSRCRLVDVLELLSDTGLGKEAHSVISQGRIEAIVTSKPRDRRLLIEEAAGLGKHRKRRRRAQLKLQRTQDNLDRALDVEREARARLRPLKRQAEAAELHARLARQTAEVRWELAREQLRERRGALAAAESAAAAARAERDRTGAELGAVAARRGAAEEALALRSEQRERLATRVERARAATERITHRLERVRQTAEQIGSAGDRSARRLALLREQELSDRQRSGESAAGEDRIAVLEQELAALDADRAAALERELVALGEQQDAATARAAAAAAEVERRAAELAAADSACELARSVRRAAGQSAESARRQAAAVGAELARANQFLRSSAQSGAAGRALADQLTVEPGLELALAAALGARLTAGVVADRLEAGRALQAAGADGARVLVSGGDQPAPSPAPAPGARRLADLVAGPEAALTVARRLLADAWVVERIDGVGDQFRGVAVTVSGRAWCGLTRELRQVAAGGAERVLAVRNERERLLGETERVLRSEQEAERAVETAAQAALAADVSRDEADRERREAVRAQAEANESVRQAQWLIEQRRKAPEQGESALRRAQLEGELAAEHRVAEQAARQREERRAQIAVLECTIERAGAIGPAAGRMAAALERLGAAAAEHVDRLRAELDADRAAGDRIASELRECAVQEAAVQQRIAACAETVTATAVALQQARDGEREAASELTELAAGLGLVAEPRDEPLAIDEAQAFATRLERLERRRAQIGPVNPLAEEEYAEALAHVEELEHRREDLETALRELATLIRDTDRQIRETFTETFNAAARNFEELAATLFPGGRGRLTLVHEQAATAPLTTAGEPAAEDAEAAAESEEELGSPGIDPDELVGVEIEITPAGKQMKRLSLLSGGEKTMTAIAFLFSVFLARPCPFYILDEVEAALDDRNITRYLDLLAAHAGRAQFIIVTHQKRTMEAADTLYGVSMGGDGVSQVVSRRMSGTAIEERLSVGTP